MIIFGILEMKYNRICYLLSQNLTISDDFERRKLGEIRLIKNSKKTYEELWDVQ